MQGSSRRSGGGGLENDRRLWSSIGAGRARGRTLRVEGAGELLKRLEGFGRQLEYS